MKRHILEKLFAWVKRTDPNFQLNELTFFEECQKWKYGTQNMFQVNRCLDAYFEKGIVPDFVAEFVREVMYPLILYRSKP